MIYVLITSLLFFFALYTIVFENQLVERSLFLISSLILITFSSLRWYTGTDWGNYLAFFHEASSPTNAFLKYAYEPGFTYFNIFFNRLSPYINVMFLFEALMIAWFKYRYLVKATFYPMICLFIFWCTFLADTFVTRQQIAMLICFISIQFVLKSQFRRFLILVIVASLFHISALFFILTYFLYKEPDSNKNRRLQILHALFVFSLGLSLVPSFSNQFNELLSSVFKFIPYLNFKIEMYNLHRELYSEMVSFKTTILGYIKRVVFLPVFYYIYLQFKKKQINFHGININNLYYLMYVSWLFGVIIYFLLNRSLPVFNRISVYFTQFEFMMLTYLFIFFSKQNRFFIFSMLSLFLFYRFYTTLESHWEVYVPYYSIFENDPHILNRKF